MTLGRPRATATVRIVDGLYLYGDQAYSPKEWRDRERARGSERTRKLRRHIVAAAFHHCEAPCPVLTPRPLCYFHLASRVRAWDNRGVGSSDESDTIADDARVSATTRGAGVVASIEVVAR